MKEISSTVVLYLFNLVSTYFMFLGYSFISKEKFKYNFKNIVFVIILAFLFLLNKKFNIVVSSVLTSIILLLLFSKIIFKNNIRNTIVYALTYYLILSVYDFIFSFFFYWLNAIIDPDLSQNYLIMGGFTLIVTFLAAISCRLKFAKKLSNKIIGFSENTYVNMTIIFLMILFIIILSTKLSLDYN